MRVGVYFGSEGRTGEDLALLPYPSGGRLTSQRQRYELFQNYKQNENRITQNRPSLRRIHHLYVLPLRHRADRGQERAAGQADGAVPALRADRVRHAGVPSYITRSASSCISCRQSTPRQTSGSTSKSCWQSTQMSMSDTWDFLQNGRHILFGQIPNKFCRFKKES